MSTPIGTTPERDVFAGEVTVGDVITTTVGPRPVQSVVRLDGQVHIYYRVPRGLDSIVRPDDVAHHDPRGGRLVSGSVVFLPLSIPGIDTWHLAPHTDGDHRCYFCQPDTFPPMPEHCTLCSRCGVFMYTGTDDPMNDGMDVCTRCDGEMSDQ